MIPADKWVWFGTAAHFICGQWCRFHLATQVGRYIVSTVGEYVHPRHSGGSEQAEAAWLKKNWPGEDIGFGRKYESMVFEAGKACSDADCGCGLPSVGEQVGFRGYNDRASAAMGHLELCRHWAEQAEREAN